MRRLTNTLVLGSCLTIASLAGIIIAVATAQQPPEPQQQIPDAAVANRLRHLRQAMAMYANENKGYVPPTLEHLEPYLRNFDPPAGWTFTLTVPPGTRLTQLRGPATRPVVIALPAARDELGTPGGVGVLYADGAIRAYRAADPGYRPEPARATPASTRAVAADPQQDILGSWQVRTGLHVATYTFNADGTFTLTFTGDVAAGLKPNYPGSGTATGTWQLEGRTLVMTNLTSDTPHTVVGEQERADVASVTRATLVLKTKDKRGRPEEVTLTRVAPAAAAAAQGGGRADDLVVGTWKSGSLTLVLADTGLAVLGQHKGEWTKQENRLVITFEQPRGDLRDRRAPPGAPPQSMGFTVELLNETTLVLGGHLGWLTGDFRKEQVHTLLRVK